VKFTRFDIEGPVLIEPKVFTDDRGYFFESFRKDLFEKEIGEINFVQDNESKSVKGVLRGLHYQLPPFAQSKLVRVVEGSVLDVAVDIRRSSPTYSKFVSVELSAENKHQFFIPRGFAHGFIVLSETAIFTYKVDNYWSKDHDCSIRFNDPLIGIDWKLPPSSLILSEKDKTSKLLKDADLFD
jgi:dTDP-4-dehydrorhamnose 3,5-epimerase